jgi:hypothetical protein
MHSRTESGFLDCLGGSEEDYRDKGVFRIYPMIRGIRRSTLPKNVIYEDAIPTRLLGRYYKTNKPKKWEKTMKYILCDFHETIDALKNGIILFDSIYNKKKRSGYFFGFEESELNSILGGSRSGSYYVLKALLCRLSVAHDEMKKMECFGDRRNAFRLQLFVDTHIDLSRYMVTYRYGSVEDGKYEDQSATKVLENNIPDYSRIYYGGDLPDLTNCTDSGNLWYDIRPRDKSMVSILIHLIACKIQSHKCQIRNFVSILYDYYRAYPEILVLFYRFTAVFMMGNYNHCKYRPKYGARMRIRQSMMEGMMADDKMILWMHENEHIVYYAAKEYYIFTVGMQYALDNALTETSDWEEVKASVSKSADVARSILCRNYMCNTETEDPFADIRTEFVSMHRKSKQFITKLRKSSFSAVLLKDMTKYHEKFVVNKNSTRSQTSESIIGEETCSAIQTVVSSFYSNQPDRIPMKWLKCFGCTESGCKAIRTIYYKYEVEEMPDNAIGRHIRGLYSKNPRDFHIARVYMSKIESSTSIMAFKMSYCSAKRQSFTLRIKKGVMPWEPLPEEADLFLYCDSCQKWANPIVDEGNRSLPLNCYSQGIGKALYDYDADKIYCEKHPCASQIKKLIENGDYADNDDMKDVSKAKLIRKHKETKDAHSHPLIGVHMLGIVVRMNNREWALCEICGGMTQYEGARFNANGYTCNKHRRDITCPLTKTGPYSHADEMDIMFTARQNSGVYLKRKPARCIYCDCEDQSSLVKVKLLEDDSMIKTYESYLCDEDYGLVYRIFEDGGTPTAKSVIDTVLIAKTRYLYNNSGNSIKAVNNKSSINGSGGGGVNSKKK